MDTHVPRLGPDYDEDGVRQGADPTWGNYANLLPVPDSTGTLAGFGVSFSSYAVAPYLAGPQTVFIPVDLWGGRMF